MSSSNSSNIQEVQFILRGFPELHDWQYWLSFPFLVVLVLTYFGNLIIVVVIVMERSLHEPMYIFISILAAIDLVPGVSLLPILLAVLWLGSQSIPFDACFIQMFVVYLHTGMESSMLVVMAYDRYIAVCKPLQYPSIVTSAFIMKLILLIILRSLCIVIPIPIIARTLIYCNHHNVYNVFCEYFSVINTACNHTVISDNYLTIGVFLVAPSDTILIALSYYMIISTALSLQSKEAQQKVFSTCSPHLIVILFFYLSGTLSVIIFIFENMFPQYIRTLFAVLYITVPPALNPIIYGLKNKEIRLMISKCFRKI
ncbi:olfactory receptor 688-like [Protopterus annectens]|uniref:olfactory receptor 688-like n=1 Tax=Protopterus annectens TaxID=7888 RepID=UPI001CF98D79|nr:olfactory receptor 688-like [Protopterus annectens]